MSNKIKIRITDKRPNTAHSHLWWIDEMDSLLGKVFEVDPPDLDGDYHIKEYSTYIESGWCTVLEGHNCGKGVGEDFWNKQKELLTMYRKEILS